MSRLPRVLYLLPRFSIGGAELAIARSLDDISPHLDIRVVEVTRPQSVGSYVTSGRYGREDVVVTSLWPAVPFARVLAPQAKWVSIFHSPIRESRRDRVVSAFAERHADVLVVDSEETGAVVRESAKRDVRRVSFFVRPRSGVTRACGSLRVAVVARNHSVKRLDRAVALVEMLLQRSLLVDAVFFTAGISNHAVAALASRWPGRVRYFLNESGQIVDAALSSAHVFVSTSAAEGFGMAIIEAMSLGVVPIVTRVGAPAVVIEHESSGYLLGDVSDQSLSGAADWVMTRFERNELDGLALSAKSAVSGMSTFADEFVDTVRECVQD